MSYSTEFKEKMVQKLLTGTKVTDLAKEINIPHTTLCTWKSKMNGKIKAPKYYTLTKKHSLLLESKSIHDEQKFGEWLRKNGVHKEHLITWEKEITEAMTNNKEKQEIRILKKENEIFNDFADYQDQLRTILFWGLLPDKNRDIGDIL